MNENKTKDMTEEEYLKWYKENSKKYDSPSVTNDIVVFTVGEIPSDDIRKLSNKQLEVLLVKRNQHPEMGKWGVIGGFLNNTMTCDENVASILKEKLNIEDVYTEQLYTFSELERDVRARILSTSYLTLTSKSKFNNISLNHSLIDYSWATIDIVDKETNIIMHSEEKIESVKQVVMNLTLSDGTVLTSNLEVVKTIFKHVDVKEEIRIISSDLAFDHAKLIYMATTRIQNKISYTNVAFHLLDKYFTLTEAQQIYEVILKKELHKSEFRRIIKPMLLETDKMSSGKGHRPSRLYQYNYNWQLFN